LKDTWLGPIATVAVGTGMRQGEITAIRWNDIDWDKATVRVERSLEETKAVGLRFKVPKSKTGIRTVCRPASAADTLKTYRKRG
jgi:integrase